MFLSRFYIFKRIVWIESIQKGTKMYSREKMKKRNLPNATTKISELCWSYFIWLLVLEIHFGSQPPLIWLLFIFFSIFTASVTTFAAFLHFSSTKIFFEYFFTNILCQTVTRTEITAISFVSRFVYYYVPIDKIRTSNIVQFIYSLFFIIAQLIIL